MKPMELVAMQPSHLSAVAAIENNTQFSPWPQAEFERSIGNPRRSAWVGITPDGIVGYLVFASNAGEAELLTISVHPNHQGQGLGKQLLQQGLALLTFESLFLEVRASNQAAIALYESLGFNAVGVRKNYYPAKKGREDAIIYAYMPIT